MIANYYGFTNRPTTGNIARIKAGGNASNTFAIMKRSNARLANMTATNTINQDPTKTPKIIKRPIT